MDTIIQIQALGQKLMPKSDRGENPDAVSGLRVECGRLRLKNLSKIIFFNNFKLKLSKWGIHQHFCY